MPWPELHAGTNFNYVWDTNTLAWVKETQPSGGSGGTGATIGAAVPATASAVAVKDNAGNLAYPNLDASGNLLVAVTGAGSGGTSSVDGAGYTAGTTAGTPALGAVDDTGTTACAEDKVGIVRITPQRAFHSNLRTQAGVEAGTSGSPLQVSLANTGANATAVKVDNSAVTQPVKLETQLDYDTAAGTVPTSIVGIALPASGGPVAGGTTTNPLNIAAAALPLPTGAATETGNLAAIKADVDKIPSQGQALAATCMPVVLPVAQITTLTPPAAITGFALDATLANVLTIADFDTKTGAVTETAPATDTASSGLNGRLQRIAQRLSSLITALGSPFQAGGSIGNTSFGSVPLTAGGCLGFHVVGAGTAGGDKGNIKASAGQLYGVHVYNNAGYPVYVKFHNTAGTPTVGTGVVLTVGVQAGLRADVPLPQGRAFGTGIGYSITKGIADADATPIVASDCVVDVDYF